MGMLEVGSVDDKSDLFQKVRGVKERSMRLYILTRSDVYSP